MGKTEPGHPKLNVRPFGWVFVQIEPPYIGLCTGPLGFAQIISHQIFIKSIIPFLFLIRKLEIFLWIWVKYAEANRDKSISVNVKSKLKKTDMLASRADNQECNRWSHQEKLNANKHFIYVATKKSMHQNLSSCCSSP